MNLHNIFSYSLLIICLAGLAIILMGILIRHLTPLITWMREHCYASLVLAPFIISMIIYGSTKSPQATIVYPYTDIELRYLTDNGSYVSNGVVKIDFTILPIVPQSAPILIDRRTLASTNDADWVNYYCGTVASTPVPKYIIEADVTNYNWIVYTTWTPGPAVQTNGVWHAYWGKDNKGGSHFIPVRTCVREDGEVIATPKSRWDSLTNQNQEE